MPLPIPKPALASPEPAYPKWLPKDLPLPPGTPVWVPEAIAGCLIAVMIGALVILSAWPRPRLPQKAIQRANRQFCPEFLTLPKRIQEIFYQNLMQGERVLWAGRASDRIARRNLGLVLMIGFSILFLAVAYGRATDWKNGSGIAAFFAFGLTGFFAYLTLAPSCAYMLTDRQAYVLYDLNAGDFVFIYSKPELAPVTVSKAWFLPRAGSVVFGKAAAAAQRGEFEGDPGPCGFPAIDDPARVAELIDSMIHVSTTTTPPEEIFRFE